MKKDQDREMCSENITNYLDVRFDYLLTVTQDLYFWLTEAPPEDIESHAKAYALKHVAEAVYRDLRTTINKVQDSIGDISLVFPCGPRPAGHIDNEILSAELRPLKSK
jgi:hypothetical protein